MKKSLKLLTAVLISAIIFSALTPAVFAAATQGKITGDSVRMRNKATTSGSTVLYTLSKGTVVTIDGKTSGQEAVSGGGTVWYKVTYSGKTGYVYGKYIEQITDSKADSDFEKQLLNFPKSYRASLRAIHKTYPNWIFKPDKLTITLDEAIDLEYSKKKLSSTRKWVEISYGEEWRDPRVNLKNSAHIKEKRWTYASREAIAFFMDPRNALKVTNSKASFPNIFTFLEQSYDSATQTEAGLKTVISGTFLENGYGGKKNAYISDIMKAANDSGVSPYVIAGTIKIEQGVKGTSSLISGKYKGYEGYFNFFNFGAYEKDGRSVVENGLISAKEKGWNSRRKSIVGGAKLYAGGYISAGQDTYYYMDFNVKYPSRIWHQYASALYDQCTKAVSMRSVCTSNKKSALTFKIPVYKSLPSSVYGIPTNHKCTGEVRNKKGATCTEDGYTGDTYCKTCEKLMKKGSVIKAAGHKYGNWIIDLPAEYDTGGKAHRACAACGEVESFDIPPLSVRIAGDINDDGIVNNKDLTRLVKYLSNPLVPVNSYAVDVDLNGIVDKNDATLLLRYLTGYGTVTV